MGVLKPCGGKFEICGGMYGFCGGSFEFCGGMLRFSFKVEWKDFKNSYPWKGEDVKWE